MITITLRVTDENVSLRYYALSHLEFSSQNKRARQRSDDNVTEYGSEWEIHVPSQFTIYNVLNTKHKHKNTADQYLIEQFLEAFNYSILVIIDLHSFGKKSNVRLIIELPSY